jgi:ammonia channel protein AmtB
METTRPITWGAAVRWLRWAPLIAGLIAFDAIAGSEGLVGALAIGVDAGLICWIAHRFLTKDIDHPMPQVTWFEALVVGALTCSLLGMQVAFVNPGGVTGRGIAVLTALALGTVLTELVEARHAREAAASRPTVGPGSPSVVRTYVAS